MLILLSVIFVGLTVIFLKIISDDDLSIIGVALFGICSFICIIAMLIVGGNLVNGNVIQDKIEMYKSENAEIDSQICEIVEGYKTYEKETFEKISNKSANVLVELYPDLKTNELVQKQMEIYMSNKNKIVSLREDLINQKPLRWWLYFGG
jgi:hypothetical protein